MQEKEALKMIDKIAGYAAACSAGFIITGSAAYRSALEHGWRFSHCDDLDCIIVFDDAKDICPSEFIGEDLLQKAEENLGKRCDLFATRRVIDGIRLSMDFVSVSYLKSIGEEPFDGTDKYRLKLIDGIESPSHNYTGWRGERLHFVKTWLELGSYRIYRLPIHLYDRDTFFAGVLLTKYLFNPVHILTIAGQKENVELIQRSVFRNCADDGDPANLYWKNIYFSSETRSYLSDLQRKFGKKCI